MSTKYMFGKVNRILFFTAILLWTGCTRDMNGVQANDTKTPEPVTESITLTATTSPTNTPFISSSTHTPIPATATPTAVPNTATPTAVPPTPSPTTLPTATLTHEQVDANLTELMLTNGGCELPCWWGIVPGETPIDSTHESLKALGASFPGDTYASFGIDWGAAIEFEVNHGIVQTMDIGGSYSPGWIDRDKYTQGWQSYSLTAVLDHYGLPTRVLVYKPFQADPGQPSYHLLVFYEDSGFEIDYVGSIEILSDGNYFACPNMADIWMVHLFLYQPSQVDNVVERILPASSIGYIADAQTVYDVISWPEATGTSLESFYETFRMPAANACFEFVTP
ncbi:MAG: hypothetical protein H6667_22680 [Ardenticatenaceae bacterium]|nr:hypothetical protein [Ardenticatenaceae bacterium]